MRDSVQFSGVLHADLCTAELRQRNTGTFVTLLSLKAAYSRNEPGFPLGLGRSTGVA